MKRVIITGSSRGIGLALTKELLNDRGFEIIGASTSGINSIESENLKTIPLNLGINNSIEKFVKTLQNTTIDYLINNAGILLEEWDKPEIDFYHLEETFRVNLFGTIRLTEGLIPQINPNGHIINISSQWGTFSEYDFNEYHPHYKMSKAALNMYTKLLSKRLEKSGVTVSAFDPGWVKTDMGGPEADRSPEEVAKELAGLLKRKIESGKLWNNGEICNW